MSDATGDPNCARPTAVRPGSRAAEGHSRQWPALERRDA